MKGFLRNFLYVATLASGVACNETSNFTTDPNELILVSRDNSPLQTSSLAYQLVRGTGEYRAYVQARYRNTTSANVHFQRCDPRSVAPMFGVRRTGPDSLRTFFSNFAWACVGGVPTGIVAPGDSVTIQVPVGSLDQPQMNPPLRPEWLVGAFRIELTLCAGSVANSDNCVLLPQSQRQSNAFVVHY